jgi:L-fuculose-phosphate aldolase
MDLSEESFRRAILKACLAMNTMGINHGTAGNISARWQNGFLITPSGLPYDELTCADLVFMRMDGTYEHSCLPSTEWRFHRDILRERPEINAIVHAHPVYATAFAICGMEIPAVHYMIAAAGGPSIPCAPYAPFGTEELSGAVLRALSGRKCMLLANHGMIAAGGDLREALWLAGEVETLCKQYAVALQVGTPRVLSEKDVQIAVEKLKDYGLRRKPNAA